MRARLPGIFGNRACINETIRFNFGFRISDFEKSKLSPKPYTLSKKIGEAVPRPGMIYVGGTDPGCFIPTLLDIHFIVFLGELFDTFAL